MTGRLSAIIGVFLLALGGYILVVANAAQTAPTAPPVLSPLPVATVAVSASPPVRTSEPVAGPASRVMADGYRVQIPRLRIDLPIREGDLARDIERQQTPEDFAFHLPDTAIPGQGSNAYFYAHARTGMFLSLWQAREGDLVYISTPDGRALKYVVSEVHPRVRFDDLVWIEPTAAERLTLQTSTGPNPRDPRFVVIAVPVPGG